MSGWQNHYAQNYHHYYGKRSKSCSSVERSRKPYPNSASTHSRPPLVHTGTQVSMMSYQPQSTQYTPHAHNYGPHPPTVQYSQGPPPGNYAQASPPHGYGLTSPPGYYGQTPPHGYYGQTPPPGNFGQALPPGYHTQTPHTHNHGSSPHSVEPSKPPAGVSTDVWTYFITVDRDRSGSINAVELREALVNNNWSHFNEETCRLLIGMFDANNRGTVNVREFQAMWKYIQDWKNCFQRFDRGNTGKINKAELSQALTDFGYTLSVDFCALCTRVFDKGDLNAMNLDDFIQCCVMVQTLTDAFKKKDAARTGVVTISYEEFLEMALDNQLV